jgi:ATP-dependent helicase/nuclease subunit A
LVGDLGVFLNYLDEQCFTHQQKEAILAADNVILEAGAGTGKTKTLVARYLRHILVEGFSPQEVVALTFTEKAAQEMKERVSDQLRLFVGSPLQGRAMRCMELIIYAPIKTFHGFSSFLIREYPVETGVDPAFSVLDEMGESILLEETINGYIAEHLDDGSLACLLSRWNIFQLKQAIRLFFSAVLTEVEMEEVKLGVSNFYSLPGMDWSEIEMEIEGALIQEMEVRDHLLQGHCSGLFKRVLNSLEMLKYLLSLYREENSLDLVFRIARELDLFPKWGRCSYLRDLQRVRELSHHLWQWLEKKVGKGFYRAFLDLAQGVQDRWVNVKRREGVLTFSDLQRCLIRGLRENHALGEELKSRYRRMLVDEYQDTNEIQREIVSRICEKMGERAGHYAGAFLERGKLFIVGDPKQSIYAFRGADVAVYARTKRQIGEEGVCFLSESFRSGNELVSFSNTLFERVFGDVPVGLDADYVVSFSKLTAQHEGGEGWVWRMEKEMEHEEAVARLVLWAKERGYRWGDMALLVRRNSTLVKLHRHLLSLGIPVVSSASGELEKRREIQDVLLYLKALDNPADDYAVAGVLMAPFVGVSHEMLLDLASLGDGLYAAWKQAVNERRFAGEEHTFCSKGLEVFEVLREFKDRLSIGALIQEVVRRTGYGAWLLSRTDGDQALANLDRLSREARKFQKGRLFTLSEFLIHVENRGLPAREAQRGTGDREALSILTVHAAKGLEFPLVILAETWSKPRSKNEIVLYDSQRGLALRIPGLAWSPWYREVKKTCEDKELEEEKRLLYVAITRAQKEVHLLLSSNPTGNNTWQSMMLDAGIEDLAHAGSWSCAPLPRLVQGELAAGELENPSPLEGEYAKEWAVDVSSLLEKPEKGEGMLGAIFHRALNEISKPAEAAKWYELNLPFFSLSEESLSRRRFVEIINSYFSGKFYAQVVAPARKVYRELALEAEFDSLRVKGRLDLVAFMDDGRLVLVEYKLERSLWGRDRHLDQLALYSWLIERCIGKRPDSVYLYYIKSGHAEEVGDRLEDRALALLEEGAISFNQRGA